MARGKQRNKVVTAIARACRFHVGDCQGSFKSLAYKAYNQRAKSKILSKERVKNDTQNIQGISRDATTLGESLRESRRIRPKPNLRPLDRGSS